MKRKELKRTHPPKKVNVNARLTKHALILALENANISIEAEARRFHDLYVANSKLHSELRTALADLDASRLSEGVLRARLNEIHNAAVNSMLGITPKGSTRLLDNVVSSTPLRAVGAVGAVGTARASDPHAG